MDSPHPPVTPHDAQTAAGVSPYLEAAPLQAGDTVRLIAPSGPTDEESLLRAIAQLESWGLNVVLGDNVRARHPRVKYLAGTDEQRRSDLVDAWCDPDTSAVIALRGGFGAMRLLDGIDFDLIRRHALRPDGRPKLLTGSSDITALHQAWDHHLSVATLFCPMVGNDPFKNSTVVPAEVATWLFEPWGGRELGFPASDSEETGVDPSDAPAAGSGTDRTFWSEKGAENMPRTSNLDRNEQGAQAQEGAQVQAGTKSASSQLFGRPFSRARTLVPGTAKGRLVGGNLSLVAAGMGSPELAGVRELRERSGPSVLMLEDVEEELYRLDNLLVQLVRGGWFDSADAVVLGSWQDCAEIDDVEALIMDYLGEAGIPIVSEMGFGHDPDAPSTPLGVNVTLEAPPRGRPRMWVDGA
ncbi:S66 peptidase family protein [Brevibacterium aurantiacum]|uniref:LD-carboxypeptidase n=1 Tax=Brevibacterium aurantiacum TaxID=273384 RepID=A0A2A3ZQB6_BREAU|nr:LD-carboxypeptidase [Brevibacterium aurantiacum]MDN5586607.1 LD-carboxypeptidase [Brevibacterium sp.]AZT94702.1 LD-carboxypeptidase [Brevibacterium aurantiacum]AZT98490.1 LD-carboxypeptidase [Brevibacterium aurantiacum]PCC53870.1 LD-carboxypeptidase [Brevibacterium aurantiacum]TGD40870.1 LD-carboxypeptidase [Brevibacterium aurantiacum]